MLYSLKVYTKGGWVRYSFLVSLVLNIVQWVWVIYNSRYINKDIAFVLHTNILAGANWYDQWWMVYLFPVVGVMGLFSYFFCGWLISKKDFLPARCVAVASIFFEIVLLVLIVFLIRINT